MIRRVRLFVLVAVSLLPGAAHTQTASLVKDIETSGFAGFSSQPMELRTVGNKIFFAADLDGSSDREIWSTDGTALGTEAVGALCSGSCSSGPTVLGDDGKLLYLTVRSGGISPRLWRSDGTRRGTFPLGLPELFISNFGTSYAIAGSRLFFEGCTDATGCELWMSDGSEAGTRTVAAPGAFPGNLEEMTAVGEGVFFLNGNQLWHSDGTAAGTILLRSFVNNRPRGLIAVGGRLFLAAEGGAEGQELWVSDGTPAGTVAVTQFAPFFPLGSFDFVKRFENRLYFVADDVTHGEELWVSDGTAAGTRRLTEFGFNRPFVPFFPSDVQEANGRLFFAASDGLSPRQLWTVLLTATAAVPTRVCSAADGCPEMPEDNALIGLGQKVVFVGRDSSHGREPWTSDGTAGGTRRLADLCPGECSGLESAPVALLDTAFFAAHPRFDRVELWRSKGTLASTFRISAPGLRVHEPPQLAALGRRLFFAASDEAGVELWTSTGAAGTTQPVADLVRDAPGSSPFDLRAVGGQRDRLVFSACSEATGRVLWGSAGTAGSTSPLTVTPFPSSCGSNIEKLTAAGGLAYFWEDDFELWRTDGTAAGTFLLGERPQFFSSSGPPPIAELGTRAVSLVPRSESTPDGPVERVDLWTSDGTPAGTGPLFTLPGEQRNPSELLVTGNEAFFTLYEPATGAWHLWRTDGTASGTRQLSGIEPGPFSFSMTIARLGSQVLFLAPGLGLYRVGAGDVVSRVGDLPFGSSSGESSALVAHQGVVYFQAITPQAWALWRTDGTTAGTRPVREFLRRDSSNPGEIVSSGTHLFFTARDAEHGEELWQSDGTAAGTTLVRDIAEGESSSQPNELTVAGGRLYFTAFDRFHGTELWQSDGTAAGTKLVQDLEPGSASSFPDRLTPATGHLYFTANDGVSGRELWVLPLPTGGCQPSSTRLCLNGGRFQVESTWKDFAGNTGVGQAVPLSGDTGYFWFFDPANVELVTKVLDAEALNQHFWVFYGALSSVEYTLTVTDTQTGATRRYTNFPGQLASVGDTQAFGPLGAFSRTPPLAAALPLISERSDPAATAPCVAGPQRLCLNGGRFAVTANWKDFQNRTGAGTAVGLTGDTGYFWFFDPANVEVVLKVLDGRGLNGKFWTFYGALSNVEYTLTVSDTQTGAVRTYTNPAGRFASVADTGAF